MALVFFLASMARPGAGQESGPRTLSLDSRYFYGSYSSQAIGQLGIELLELATFPAGQVAFDGETGGFGPVILLALGSGFLGGAFSLAYHEYGHGTRSAAAGYRPFFGHGENPSDETLDEIFASRDPMDTFFEYYLESLFDRSSGYTVTSTEETLFPPLSLETLRDNGWNVNIRAGGLNNEMYFTQMIEDHFYRERGNLGFLVLYITGKISAWRSRYGADVINIVDGYSLLGIEFDDSDVDAASLGSFLLSGMTYQLFHQLATTAQGAPIYFQPWSWRGFQIPNTSFYMTSSGLSYRVGSGYRRGEWRYPFAVESVFRGGSRTELSLGAERRFDFGDVRMGTTVGRQIELSLDMTYRVHDRFVVSAGYALFDKRNFHGERLIPSLEHGERYHDLSFRASLVY